MLFILQAIQNITLYITWKGHGRSQDFSNGWGGGGVAAGTPYGDRRLYIVYTAALPRVSAGSVVLSRHEGPY